MEVSCKRYSPGHSTLGGESAAGTHWIGGWVNHRASKENSEKKNNLLPTPGMESQFLGHQACSLVTMSTTQHNTDSRIWPTVLSSSCINQQYLEAVTGPLMSFKLGLQRF
jgi:hypothetical protein